MTIAGFGVCRKVERSTLDSEMERENRPSGEFLGSYAKQVLFKNNQRANGISVFNRLGDDWRLEIPMNNYPHEGRNSTQPKYCQK